MTLNETLKKFAQEIMDNEKIPTLVLVAKAKQLAQAFPFDTTCRDMYNVLDRKSSKQHFMTKKEFKNLYTTLYSSNNKFAQAFEKELDIVKSEPKKIASENKPLPDYQDPFLKNALASVFDKSKTFIGFTDKNAKNALKVTDFQLKSLNLDASYSLNVATGNEEYIICRASYLTPKGNVSVLIPSKIEDGLTKIPNSFITEGGLISLNGDNLKNYIIKNAGKILTVNANQLLEALSKKAEVVSEVEAALFKIKSAKMDTSGPLGLITQTPFDKIASVIKMTKHEVPDALKPFTEKLGSKSGEAAFIFGKEVVEAGRNNISGFVKNCGFKDNTVVVADCSNDQIVYSVSVHNKAFKVPVKIANKIPALPLLLIVNGSVKKFSSEAIREIVSAEETDSNALLTTYSKKDEPISQLNKDLKNSLNIGDMSQADEILHILYSKDKASFADGLNLYKEALLGKKIEKVECKCSKQIKASSNSDIICGHTGLSLNKVYQDKNGQCQPLYRKAMEDAKASTVPVIISDKAFWS